MGIWQKLFAIFLTVLLVGCGGGGGGSGSACPGQLGCTASATASSAATYSVTLSATAAGVSSASLKYGAPLNLTATLLDSKGNPVVGAKLTFVVSDVTLASVSKGGSVLSDGNGQGSVALSASSNTSQGVVSVTVTGSVPTVTNGVATATANYQINASTIAGTVGAPAKLRYVSASATRLFIRGASAGNVNAVETTQVKFEVRDINDNIIPNVAVYFDVTKRNVVSGGSAAGILTCTPDNTGTCVNVAGSSAQTSVLSDNTGIATITVQSGSEPISFNVLAALSAFNAGTYSSSSGLAGTIPIWLSNDQIVVSSNIPDQSKFFVLWNPAASCGKGGPRIYPCAFVANVFDILGQPVADGTAVNFVTATGGVVMDTLGNQPSGTCLTKNSQCTGNYFGIGSIPNGSHVIVGYVNSKGGNAPIGQAVCNNGPASGSACPGGTVVVSVPSSDDYLRAILNDVGP